MKTLTITVAVLIGLYVGFGVALNSAADLAIRLWGVPKSQISQSNGQAVFPDYQVQSAADPQQPNVVLQATPSNALQP